MTMSSRPRGRVSTLVGSALAVLLLGGVGLAAVPASAHSPSKVKPTIVLVHGAFGDASGWNAEVAALTKRGYTVLAPADPLRGVASDASYIRHFLATIKGPVVLVGHSYGGMVITNAAVGAPNVKALVYVSAFIPAKGDPAAYFTDPANYPGSLLGSTTLLFRPTVNPAVKGGKDTDVYIAPTAFHAIFAGDQSARRAQIMAAEQRPVSLAAYTEKSGVPAWSSRPSWALISLEDKAIPPAAQEFMAARAGAHVTLVHSAHDSLVSHPATVVRLIVQAATSVS